MIWHILCLLRQLTGYHWPHWLYKAYLRSYDWQLMRLRILKRANGNCEYCHKPTLKHEIHHITYVNLGWESMSDLVAVCPDCHKELHSL